MSHINKNNASHLSELLFKVQTHVYIFSTLNHETFKYKNPELAHEYNSQMFNKMSRKNTF